MDFAIWSSKLMLMQFWSNSCMHETNQWIQSSDWYSVRIPK